MFRAVFGNNSGEGKIGKRSKGDSGKHNHDVQNQNGTKLQHLCTIKGIASSLTCGGSQRTTSLLISFLSQLFILLYCNVSVFWSLFHHALINLLLICASGGGGVILDAVCRSCIKWKRYSASLLLGDWSRTNSISLICQWVAACPSCPSPPASKCVRRS